MAEKGCAVGYSDLFSRRHCGTGNQYDIVRRRWQAFKYDRNNGHGISCGRNTRGIIQAFCALACVAEESLFRRAFRRYRLCGLRRIGVCCS